MSRILLDQAYLCESPFQSNTAKLVWFCLIRDAGADRTVVTSASRIAREIKVSEKMVRNVLSNFVSNELIEVAIPALSPTCGPKEVRYASKCITLTSIGICATKNKPAVRKKSDLRSEKKSDIVTRKTSSKDLMPYPALSDFVNPMFHDAFTTWLDYKKRQFGFEYKAERSIKVAYAELVRLSANDPLTAMRIVEQSMCNGWKGLFELKSNETERRTDDYTNRKEKRDRGLSLATEIVSRSENLLNLFNGGGSDTDTGRD